MIDENSIELSETEKADLIAEEEAVALAAKPLDEILQLPPELQDPVMEEDLEPDTEEEEFEEEFGLKELDETLDSIEAVDIKFADTESDSDTEPDSQAESDEEVEDTVQSEPAGIEIGIDDDDTETKH